MRTDFLSIPLSELITSIERADADLTMEEFRKQLEERAKEILLKREQEALDPRVKTIIMEGPDRFKCGYYKPTCKFDCGDCIYDPAYIHTTYPEWYKELYGAISPEEAATLPDSTCSICSEDDYRYDDEDK